MTKLELAHDWAMKMLEHDFRYSDAIDIAARAWQYADAMQAEADKRIDKSLPDVLKIYDSGDFQVDWNVAPDWANWWSITKHGQGHWFLSEPKIIEESWVRETRECKQAPTFNYQGNWQDSLRKRPEHERD